MIQHTHTHTFTTCHFFCCLKIDAWSMWMGQLLLLFGFMFIKLASGFIFYYLTLSFYCLFRVFFGSIDRLEHFWSRKTMMLISFHFNTHTHIRLLSRLGSSFHYHDITRGSAFVYATNNKIHIIHILTRVILVCVCVKNIWSVICSWQKKKQWKCLLKSKAKKSEKNLLLFPPTHPSFSFSFQETAPYNSLIFSFFCCIWSGQTGIFPSLSVCGTKWS